MISNQALRDRYRLKWIPVGLDEKQLDSYRGYLDMTDDERAIVSRTVGPEELDLLLELETARAMYLAAEDRDPGSITEAKVARYPERYR
ncbi:hypothetical protein HFN06_06080 [Rhizobium leguminosarum]|uniref:hypothetical protein n=1 Tax=Rhizobium TaxID=379 RepID=UPI001441BA4E|nr:hypothetical protein [Rhizobium leguminosarum]MCA2431012.1 hypothetical protein [Rhizobium leguminosarum]NKK09142.1 hypothetical protein [Rhizobium leguminosarum bv. viciae]